MIKAIKDVNNHSALIEVPSREAGIYSTSPVVYILYSKDGINYLDISLSGYTKDDKTSGFNRQYIYKQFIIGSNSNNPLLFLVSEKTHDQYGLNCLYTRRSTDTASLGYIPKYFNKEILSYFNPQLSPITEIPVKFSSFISASFDKDILIPVVTINLTLKPLIKNRINTLIFDD